MPQTQGLRLAVAVKAIVLAAALGAASPGIAQSKKPIPPREKKPRIVRTAKGTSGPYHDMKIAMGLLTKARVDAAKKLLEKITIKLPKHAEAWHLLATCCELKRNTQDAHKHARHALDLMPEHARAALLLARIHKQDDMQMSADYARLANKNAGKDVVVRRSAARTLMETGNLDEAALIVKELAVKNPTGQRLLFLRAELALALQDFLAAKKHYSTLSFLRPLDPIPYENIAGILRTEGNLEGAIKALERALELQPGKRSSRERLIEFLIESGAQEDRIAKERAALRKVAKGGDVSEEAPKPSPRR